MISPDAYFIISGLFEDQEDIPEEAQEVKHDYAKFIKLMLILLVILILLNKKKNGRK